MKKIPFKISDEEIVRIYLETKSLRQTAMAAQGITGTSTVARKLRSLGVEVKNYKLKPIQASDEELIRMYNSGMTLMEIANKVSGSKGAMMVRQRLQKLGIDTSYNTNISKYKEKMSHAFHHYNLDEHVFDVIDSEEKAYWLGFLMADGYNHANKSAICLRLNAIDTEILEKFRAFLKSDAPIYNFRRQTAYSSKENDYKEVRVNSVHLSKRLAELGCVQRKTYILEFPSFIPDNLMNHFIRGYFDGDGCISIINRNNRKSENSKTYQFTIAGRREFLLEVQKHLAKNANVVVNPLKTQPNNFAQIIHYGGFNVVLRLLNYLYKDATIYLKRKHDKYLQMVVRQSNLQKSINPVNSGNTLRA